MHFLSLYLQQNLPLFLLCYVLAMFYKSQFHVLAMVPGTVSCWGMGTSKQLGNGSEDDAWVPTKMAGKQLENR